MKATEKVMYNGELAAWEEAKVHVLAHALHYGTGVFESCRCYDTCEGPAVFRLKDHMRRLVKSGAAYNMELPYTVDELCAQVIETIRANNLRECYVRTIAFFGYRELGVCPLGNPVDVSHAVWEWGAYLGEDGMEKGVKATISTWRRIDPSTMPPTAKATANYANASLAKVEAVRRGFDEAIMLNTKGSVAEGSGENLFTVKDEVLKTTSEDSGALPGITQDTVRKIASDIGYEVKEGEITVEELKDADEAFFTGTAAEVTPIRQIDDREYGGRGQVTERIQSKYLSIVRGEERGYDDWLTPARPA
ncbi:MAG: branched-chain amino acid transaminase [Candidatus Altiarchaeales archaeon]|nr:branched-chain amino acid transaminase [Candidatus Altiarchaeales archaeon]MBD3417241.1 branched-chain amino acid transaminase [Candidatus Altiarchaeales archaeon]